jgi:hypothetical protein
LYTGAAEYMQWVITPVSAVSVHHCILRLVGRWQPWVGIIRFSIHEAIPIGLLVLFLLKNPEPKAIRNLKDIFTNAVKSIKNRQLFGIFFASAANFILLYGAHVTYLRNFY